MKVYRIIRTLDGKTYKTNVIARGANKATELCAELTDRFFFAIGATYSFIEEQYAG